jgi:oxygen-independent coproporphyrinogen III oxidase
MCNLIEQKENIQQLSDIDFDVYFSRPLASLKTLEEDGLCILNKNFIQVTDRGRYFLRNIAVEFDRYKPTNQTERMFSRTV